MARCAAKYFMEEDVPIRFSYLGNTFTNTGNLQGKLKEVTQMGAELMGDGSVEADGEMIAMAIEALLAGGLEKFQLSIGEIDYFKGLCEEAGLDEETELSLRDYISGKNIFGAENLLTEKGIDEKHRKKLLQITEYIGSSAEVLKRAGNSGNSRSENAVERLKKLYQVLCEYGVEKYVSFDLGMLSKYNYYTGVIFKAYTYGVGDAILKGGRYDNLLACFGKTAPAVGFVIVIDDLLQALNRQKALVIPEDKTVTLSYGKNNYREKLAEAAGLRKQGIRTVLVPENGKER
jgi:ATP phosphoribosyltransferase regulatory subunit